MSKFRGRCLALFTALAAAVTLVAFAVPAQAFLIQNHESITRAALPIR